MKWLWMLFALLLMTLASPASAHQQCKPWQQQARLHGWIPPSEQATLFEVLEKAEKDNGRLKTLLSKCREQGRTLNDATKTN